MIEVTNGSWKFQVSSSAAWTSLSPRVEVDAAYHGVEGVEYELTPNEARELAAALVAAADNAERNPKPRR